MLDHFPEKRRDVEPAAHWWPLGPRLTYIHDLVWVGPAGTVSGLHFDIPNKRVGLFALRPCAASSPS